MQLGCRLCYLRDCLQGSKQFPWQSVQASTLQGLVWLIILILMIAHGMT